MSALPLPHHSKIIDTIALTYAGNSKSSSFGDGYEQAFRIGLDDLKVSSTITMKNLSQAEATTVSDFLNTVGVQNAFLIPLEGEPDMIVRLKEGTYTKSPIKVDTFTISFGIIEHKFPGVTP